MGLHMAIVREAAKADPGVQLLSLCRALCLGHCSPDYNRHVGGAGRAGGVTGWLCIDKAWHCHGGRCWAAQLRGSGAGAGPPPPLPESAISGDVNVFTSCQLDLTQTHTHTRDCVNRWCKRGQKGQYFQTEYAISNRCGGKGMVMKEEWRAAGRASVQQRGGEGTHCSCHALLNRRGKWP